MSNINSKHCDFTFALSDLIQANRIISELPDFDTWAYIKHFPDIENSSDHYHFYLHLKQPITVKNLSVKLDIPANMIEWVRNKTKLIQYLIHKNNPEKIQYLDKEIETNNREYLNKFLNPTDNKTDVINEFRDLSKVSRGRLSAFDYVKLHSDSLANLPFYSRSTFLIRLLNLERGFDDK